MVWPTKHDFEENIVAPCPHTLPLQHASQLATSHLEHICNLDIRSKAAPVRLSGIICTIGPASRDPAILEELMETGMNIARLNFSHGTHEYHAETIVNIRKAVSNYVKKIGMPHPLAIALDTKGPEIRTGLLQGGGSAEVELKKGDTFKLTTDKGYAEKGNANMVYVDYDTMNKVVHIGDKIYVDDGLMSLVCTHIQGSVITCTVENGGMLGSKKGINLPGIPVDLPAVSEKDKSDLRFGVEQGVDMIFASFIRNGAALAEIRDILGAEGRKIMIISKIENQQGMQNLNEIIRASDGIMVARGDLGIEIPTEKVFLAQKEMIAKCNVAGKPITCATQMLESMTKKPRPTRAESGDVANAIFDGADCVMLSGETAKGDYPLDCVHVMSNICKEAEAAVWNQGLFRELKACLTPPVDCAEAVAIAVVEASIHTRASAIVTTTTTGRSAHLIAKYRPSCPIITVTRNAQVARQCHLYRALLPLLFEAERLNDWEKDLKERLYHAVDFGKQRGFLKNGDVIIVVAGSSQGAGYTNTMKIVVVGSTLY